MECWQLSLVSLLPFTMCDLVTLNLLNCFIAQRNIALRQKQEVVKTYWWQMLHERKLCCKEFLSHLSSWVEWAKTVMKLQLQLNNIWTICSGQGYVNKSDVSFNTDNLFLTTMCSKSLKLLFFPDWFVEMLLTLEPPGFTIYLKYPKRFTRYCNALIFKVQW